MRTVTTEVEVEIDLDDFDTEELVEILCRRLRKRKSSRNAMTDKEKRELIEALEDINVALGLRMDDETLPVKTLDDKMKLEHIIKVWGKYTSEQFENLLP